MDETKTTIQQVSSLTEEGQMTKIPLVTKTEVQLEKPGAGINFLERGLIKLAIIPVFGFIYGPKGALRFLEEQTQLIVNESRTLTNEQIERPVLLERLHGIEDSSRNWSVAQVIEHLDIVIGGGTAMVEELAKDNANNLNVKIEDVKPKSESNQRLSPIQFQVNMKEYLTRLRKIENIQKYKATNAHPWFGPFTAYQWLLLFAVHHNLHFRQIQKIVQAL